MVNVTIVSRKDTISNWQTSNPVLSDGEVAVVEIPATDSTPAICLIKIGDGQTPFNTLQYMQSPAADVYAWAKKATKPEYDYSEIKNLTTMIVAGNNVTATTNDNKVTIATTQNVAKIPGTLPDIGDIEALPVWNSDEGWKRIDADALKATANTIVKRNASGQIVAAAPTANTHVTNKKYVDDAVSAKQDTISAGTGITINDNTVAVNSKIVPVAPAGGMGYASPGVVVNTAASQMVEPNWQTVGVGYSSLSGNIAKYNGSAAIGDGLGGTLPVSTPLADNHAANKKYVDDAVGEKQDKLTAGNGISLDSDTVKISDNVARTTSTDLGTWIPVQTRPTGPSTWSDVKVSADGAESDSIVKRTAKGQVFVATPTSTLHAATKKYVDDNIATKQNTLTAGNGISITGNSVAIDDSVTSTKTYVQTAYKAGSNVTISDPDASGIRTISATGGGGGGTSYTAGTGINISGTEISVSDTVAMKTDVTSAVSGKQDKLTAGKGISLSGSTLAVNDDVATIETYQDGDYIPVCFSGAWSSTGVLATQGADANAIAIRRNSGALFVPTTPTDDNEAASKAYVDGKIGVTYSAGTGISISASNAISVDTTTIATKSEVNDLSTGVSGISTQVNEVQTGLSTVSAQVNNLSGTYTLIENDVAYTSTLAIGDEYEFGLWAPHIQDDGTATVTVGTETIVAASIAQEDGALTGKITVVSTNESGTAGNGLFYTLVYAGTCKTGFVSAQAGQTLSLLPHAGGPVGTAKRSYVIKTTRTLS